MARSSRRSTCRRRVGRPFFASVSAVARPCAATRSPMRRPAKPGSPARRASSGVDRRPLPGRADGQDGEQLVLRPGEIELLLRVLVDRPDRRDRLRALAVLAEALGPELHPPAREALEPVGIGHEHGDRLALHGEGEVERRARAPPGPRRPRRRGTARRRRPRRRGSRRCRGRARRPAGGRHWSGPNSARRCRCGGRGRRRPRARGGRAGRSGRPRRRGSERPRKSSPARARKPARSSAESTAIACIRVSPVPPDFEIATKREVASGSALEERRRRSAGRGCRGSAPAAPRRSARAPGTA